MRSRAFLAAAFIIAALCAATVLSGGCGAGGRPEYSYVVEQGDLPIGSQTVRLPAEGGVPLYSSVERRPFKPADTATYRKLTLTAGLEELEGYYSSRRVPGAAYRTWISREGDKYSFLADDLQTFDDAVLQTERTVLPYESDSACLMQALADRFFGSDLERASAFAVVPSRGALLRELLVERDGNSGLKVTSPGLPDVRMQFDGSGVLSEAEGGGLVIRRGNPGAMNSRAFMPVAGARAVKEVRVRTPEELDDGEHLELAGSFYIPAGKGPHPAVVLAGDFGPHDRTGNGFIAQVARRLVDDGFAVLACDKRGIPGSQGDYGRYTRLTAEEDLNAQVDYMVLRGDVDIDNISLVGYGEGGQLASAVAASNPYVRALVLMATPSVPLFPDLTAYQLHTAESSGLVQPAEITSERLRLETEARVLNETSGDTVELQGHELFLGWMRSQAYSDPMTPVGELSVPVLVMQGGRDVVVAPAHSEAMMKALAGRGRGTQELALFDELGHDFGPMLSEAVSIPYRAHPEVEPGVLEKLSTWLKSVAR